MLKFWFSSDSIFILSVVLQAKVQVPVLVLTLDFNSQLSFKLDLDLLML